MRGVRENMEEGQRKGFKAEEERNGKWSSLPSITIYREQGSEKWERGMRK